jgi:glutamyl-tRNA synthetase
MDDLERNIWLEGLRNAVKFDGKANMGAIMGKIMSTHVELRSQAQKVKSTVIEILKQINSMDLSSQKEKLLEMDPHALDKKEKLEEKKELPDLAGAQEGKVVMRLAPYPSGGLHIGNARMIVLNDEYVKRYKGKLLLVFDDTIGTTKAKMKDVNAKYIIPEAYDLIPEGLDWLGVKYHETHYKSDRLDIYQDEAQKMIDQGKAYVCDCDPKEFREKFKRPGKECPCRNKPLVYHQEMYDKMKGGGVQEQGAVVRLKTGMDQKDPAMRDHIIMRISDAPHPRVGTKYRLWPILEWSWGLDDHLLGVTHIIRGIDLKKEGDVEKFIWNLYGWEPSHITLYGRLKFEDLKLSKTYARNQIQSGEYDGWEDPRTWSLQSLNARGITPQSLREALLDLGLSKRGIIFDQDWVYSRNKSLIDPDSNRYWFVEYPVKLTVDDIKYENDTFIAHPLVNPSLEEKGTREIILPIENNTALLYLSKDELNTLKSEKGTVIHPKLSVNDVVRLKDLFNISITDINADQTLINAKFHSLDKMSGIRKMQAVPAEGFVNLKVIQPDGKITRGYAETNLRNVNVNDMVHFIRYGYCRIQKITNDEIYAYYTHP